MMLQDGHATPDVDTGEYSATALAEHLHFDTAEFPAACSDLSAILQERAHAELIGGASFSSTALLLEDALCVYLRAQSGDADAFRRLESARAFVQTEDAARLEDGDFAIAPVADISAQPEPEQARAENVDTNAPADREEDAPKPYQSKGSRTLTRQDLERTKQAYVLREQGASWKEIECFLGLTRAGTKSRMTRYAERNGLQWPIVPEK